MVWLKDLANDQAADYQPKTETNNGTMAAPAPQQSEEPLHVSVDDHESFMQRHLPDLGQEVEDATVYTWNITNWKKLERKISSPDFSCGVHKWRVATSRLKQDPKS
ncbi:hypothetical protein FRB91_003319 [Serendipita sp. 411]|nr:hypothetical protein FRB91_003319 [Serendipita sp. 411]